MSAITDYFLPQKALSSEQRRKAVLFINFILVLSVFSFTYLILCYFTNIIIGVWTNLIMFPGCITALFVFRHTSSFAKGSNIAVFGFVAGIAEGVLFSGNTQSPAITWLIVAPSLAFLLGNKREGIIWTGIVIALLLAFGLINISGFKVPYIFPAYLQNYIMAFTLIAVTVFFAIIISIYDTIRTKSLHALAIEKEKSEHLLLNILPEEVSAELKERGATTAKEFDAVTILFTDFVNFTTAGERMNPKELVEELHYCFKAFDEITDQYHIEKIKTVGDAYLAVSGLPEPDENHAMHIVRAALDIRNLMHARRVALGDKTFEVRIGIHSGPVVAGIVGVKKFAYDIWGDTVNTAARMEQSGEAGKINISESTHELVKDNFECAYRGAIDAKNKGKMDMYFVN